MDDRVDVEFMIPGPLSPSESRYFPIGKEEEDEGGALDACFGVGEDGGIDYNDVYWVCRWQP